MKFSKIPSTSLEIIEDINKNFAVSIFLHDHEHLISSSTISSNFHLRHDHPFCEQKRHEKKEWFENCRRCCSTETNEKIKSENATFHSECWKSAEQIIHPVYEQNKLLFTIFAGPFKSNRSLSKTNQEKAKKSLPYLSEQNIESLKLYVYALHANLIIEFSGKYSNITTKKSRKKKIETYIERNYDKNISLTTLAQELKISASRASHVIQEEFNIGFNEILLKMRILKAKKLLLHSDLSTAEIATKVGFKSSSYFHVCFKKQLGISPSQFKSQLARPI